MKIFLSWSGTRSNKVALAFKEWIPTVIHSIKEDDIFVSSEDIHKGEMWRDAVAKELEESNFGIICATKENAEKPWLLFESGALSKKDKSYVCTFLLDLTNDDILKSPLSAFNSTKFEKDDIFKLVKTIKDVSNAELSESQIKGTFNGCYPKLQKQLSKINNGDKDTKENKSVRACEYPEELECGRLKIEQELDNIKKSGVIKVFENQSCAVKDFKKDHKSSDIKTTKILGIRGDNFVREGKENWSSIIPMNSYKMTILGNPDDDNMIMSRYEAQKLRDDETPERFKQRYRDDMLRTQNILKDYPNNTMLFHNESDLPFRMIFIDDYLFLSTYYKNIIASEAEVIKIYKSSTLYSMCEEYFNKIELI